MQAPYDLQPGRTARRRDQDAKHHTPLHAPGDHPQRVHRLMRTDQRWSLSLNRRRPRTLATARPTPSTAEYPARVATRHRGFLKPFFARIPCSYRDAAIGGGVDEITGPKIHRLVRRSTR